MGLLSKQTNVHHRNPSGFRNKVNWVLSQMKWDLNNYDAVFKQVYPIGYDNGYWHPKYMTKEQESWKRVFEAVRYILLPNNIRKVDYECIYFAQTRLQHCKYIVKMRKEHWARLGKPYNS